MKKQNFFVMRIWLTCLLLVEISTLLLGCGGGSDGRSIPTGPDTNANTEGLVNAANQKKITSIQVTSTPETITIGGTATFSATLLDENNETINDGTTVYFTVDSAVLGTIVASATTMNGVATSTFLAGTTQAGTATITASAGGQRDTQTINIQISPVGSIEFISADPQIVSIKGSGGIEISKIQFQINDTNGNPIIESKKVTVTLSGPNGGEALNTTEAYTINGIASVFLHSGKIPGTATIIAHVDGTDLNTSSGVIAIGGGAPSANHFSLSTEKLNLPGLVYQDETTQIIVRLADRFGNYNVLAGTMVSFYSECGAIDRAVALDDKGQGSVTFRTQAPVPLDVDMTDACGTICEDEMTLMAKSIPSTASTASTNPRDGLCTITAVVDGEETFIDSNANGEYDMDEKFTDTNDDIYIEKNDNGVHDPLEDLVVDRERDGTFNGPNDIWDGNKRLAKTINLLYTGRPQLEYRKVGSTVDFALYDDNYNAPMDGTTISVSVEVKEVNGVKEVSTLTGDTNYTYNSDFEIGSPILNVAITGGQGILIFIWTWHGITYEQRIDM